MSTERRKSFAPLGAGKRRSNDFGTEYMVLPITKEVVVLSPALWSYMACEFDLVLQTCPRTSHPDKPLARAYYMLPITFYSLPVEWRADGSVPGVKVVSFVARKIDCERISGSNSKVMWSVYVAQTRTWGFRLLAE